MSNTDQRARLRDEVEGRDGAAILIVDDDPGLVRLVQKALEREGFQTQTALSGESAVEWLSQHRADLMLLDLKLQDIGARELVERLAEIDRVTPYIIITGQGDERVAVEMMKGGAMDYLVKDAEFLHFLPEVVRRALVRIEQERRLANAEQALKREHAFTSAVLDTSGALVVVLDREGRIVRFNRACEHVTGFTFDEVRGKPVWNLFLSPEELDLVRGVFERLRAGQFPIRHENFWVTKKGDRRLIVWSNTVLLDPKGNVEYVISSGIDTTEQRRLEKEILEISDREQRRIGQDLHDGLGQHLAGIELMSEVLEQRLSSKAKPEASRAGEIARHVREAISQTRLLARGLSPVMLESEGLMSALQELAVNTEKMFRVRCRFACEEPVLVEDYAVATHLYRIAQEAVSNAIKHGKAREIVIRLQLLDGVLKLAVQDNGTGFPDVLPKNTGMGLRIMRYRAGMIGGSLIFQNDPTGGGTVICLVPLTKRS